MHVAWDRDHRPSWQVHLSFLAGPPAESALSTDLPSQSSGIGAGRQLEDTIRETGKARRVSVALEHHTVTVSLRIKATSRGEAIPDAYHLVRVAARVASSPLLGEVRRADAFRWPPPVAGG